MDELKAGRYGAHPGQLHFHVDSLGQSLQVPQLIHGLGLDPDTHVYTCGPQALIDAVRTACRQQGWADAQVHHEQFTPASDGGGAYQVRLARSGVSLQVPAGSSLLQALEKSGLAQVESLCREGVCGTCETRILAGAAEHRDQYLSEAEKAGQKSLMVCVSRALGEGLVLDL